MTRQTEARVTSVPSTLTSSGFPSIERFSPAIPPLVSKRERYKIEANVITNNAVNTQHYKNSGMRHPVDFQSTNLQGLQL